MGFLRRALLGLLLAAMPAWAEIRAPTVIIDAATDSVDRTVYTTASVSLQPKQLVIAQFGNTALSGAATVTPVPAGHSLTWTPILSQTFNSTSTNTSKFSLWWAVTGSTVSTGTMTFTTTAETQTAAGWSVWQIMGADLSAPIVQSASARVDAGNTLTPTLATFANAENATFIALGGNDVVTCSGMTATGSRGCFEFDSKTDPTVTFSSVNACAISFEVRDARRPAVTNLQDSGSGTDNTVFSLTSWTPVANRPYLLVINSETLLIVPAATPVVAGNSLTWTNRYDLGFDPLGALATRHFAVVEGVGASPTAEATTMTFGSTQTGIRWSLLEIRDGQSPVIVQTGHDETDTTSDTSTVLTLPAAYSSTLNSALVAAVVDGASTSAVVEPWLETLDTGNPTHVTEAISQHETGWTNTWSAGARNAGAIFELDSIYEADLGASGAAGGMLVGE